jgi:hypothetical protein
MVQGVLRYTYFILFLGKALYEGLGRFSDVQQTSVLQAETDCLFLPGVFADQLPLGANVAVDGLFQIRLG